jgi:hypothetical protein
MTGQVLTPNQRRNVALFATDSLLDTARTTKKFASPIAGTDDDPAPLQLKGVPVFRSGTFKDSMGMEHTWTSVHIHSMKSNFDFLKDQKIFDKVPVRGGHMVFGENPIETLVGWHDDLRVEDRVNPVDGETYTYLIADFTVIEEDAIENVNSGLWVNRSAEVGTYTTNDSADYWPCYMGVAYVDIPAIEGLNVFHKFRSPNASIMFETETSTVTAPTATLPPVEAPVAPVAPVAPAHVEPVLSQAERDKAAQDELDRQAGEAVRLQQQGQHSKNGTFAFSMNGEKVTDFAKVQQHLATLEEFAKTTQAATRVDFVKGLASNGKIVQTQVEVLTAYSSSLTPEGFTAWSATFDSTPTNPVFGKYDANATVSPEQQTGQPTAVDTYKETVATFSRMGMDKKVIMDTDSYKKLIKAEPNFSL